MILSERQYNITKALLEKMRADLGKVATAADDWVDAMMADALKSQVADLAAELAEYETLRGGNLSYSGAHSLRDLPLTLIRARIAKGLSQTDLAQMLGMKPQQVQRYEATEYMGASLARLIEVADALGVQVQESFSSDIGGRPNQIIVAWQGSNEFEWLRFPLKEMQKRGWFDGPPGSDNIVETVRDYFLAAAGPRLTSALHRKKIRADHLPDEYSLLAWQARVLSLANRAEATMPREFDWHESWLAELRSLTRFNDGPAKAADLLRKNGILVVVEPHLPGTYLDGAAMVSRTGRPVIGITLRYDRLDHFWFVLLHELGHVLLHLSTGLPFDFFDVDEGETSDLMEREADHFALATVISDADWDTCLSRFALTEEAVRADADRLGVGASIVAGRIRKERNNYEILNACVGAGLVREQFWG